MSNQDRVEKGRKRNRNDFYSNHDEEEPKSPDREVFEDHDFEAFTRTGLKEEKQNATDADTKEAEADNPCQPSSEKDVSGQSQSKGKGRKGPLSVKKLAKFKKKHDNTGVVYLSTVPPFMRVQKLRSILSQYGHVMRIYLTPEDAAITRKRKKYRKNRRVKHTDGWVEFADKRVAKKVALALNNTPIGGKKRDYYSQDIWNIKYLKKFKWHHLTEKISYESQVKHQKVRNSVTEAQLEAKFYLDKAGQSKALKAMKRKREKRRKFAEEGGKESSTGSTNREEAAVIRKFKQREILED